MSCKIHTCLDERGFAGCIRYTCLGAGQRVSQQVFHGETWRDDPALLVPMLDAFRAMRQVHELLELLQTAAGLSLTPKQRIKLAELTTALTPNAWTRESLSAFEHATLAAEIHTFLTSLRGQVSRN